MSMQKAYLGRLTIPISQDKSNVLVAEEGKMARGLLFSNVETAFTGTIAVLVGHDEAVLIANMLPAYVDGTQVTVSANRVQQWTISGVVAVALDSSGTEAAARNVDVWLLLELPD